jgi:predicted amidophosphoribosyltransferase
VHALCDGKHESKLPPPRAIEPPVMSNKTCRDCGNVLEQHARGCPRCAMNFEAESIIDRFVWRRLVPGVFVVVLMTVTLIYLLR